MVYKLILEFEDGESERTEIEGRREAVARAENLAWPAGPSPLTGFSAFADPKPPRDRYVELIDAKGARILDAVIPKGSRYALAWRDGKRTWVRGFVAREEAAEARADVPEGCEAVILNTTQKIPWATRYDFTRIRKQG